jgi:hypothetical protein
MSLPEQQWLSLVKETRICILNHPEDFLGPSLPPRKITRQVINIVFEGFMADVYIRKVQAFRNNDFINDNAQNDS